MSHKENNQDANPSLIEVEGDRNQIDNVLVKDYDGTAVGVKNANKTVVRDSEFRNVSTAVQSADSSLTFYRSAVTNSVIGFDAQEGTEATVINVTFDDNELADIVYYDDVSIELLDVIAEEVLGITQPLGLHPADIELSRKAHEVINTRDESEKREAFLDLSISARDIAKQIGSTVASQYVIKALEYIWRTL